jgi:site-specific DNA-methyltransferase (adenine-specific)
LASTDENDLVLDNCAGSGTTGIAAKNLNRQFILIEKEDDLPMKK